MATTNFSSDNNTYRKLIGNGLTYKVPPFQRDYSWTEEEWSDLWSDMTEALLDTDKPVHYMGYLVLQTNDGKSFDVIDGQQRLTTLSLIVLAGLKNLQRLIDEGVRPEQNKQRLDQIRSSYIGYLDPVTLETHSKLSLNRNNNAYFQNYIVPLLDLPVRGFKGSEHSLRKAFEWYEKHLREWIRQDHQSDAGVAIATFIESMCDRLFFTVITVTDELNAYKVFETLNARGVRLSSTDLLKNYLFSVLHKDNHHAHEMQRLEDRWEAIVTRLGGESFTEFVRSHWNSRYSFVRTPNLFRTIKSTITNRGKVFEFLRDMDADIDHYLAITNPESATLNIDLRRPLLQLKMFRVRQPYPLLLTAWRVLEPDQFKVLLNACVVIVFRYNVIASLPTNEQEGVYHSAAQKLLAVSAPTALDGIRALASIYPTDDSFKAYFSEKVVKTTDSRNNKVMRYLLSRLEYQQSEQSIDIDEPTVTIEHVLPQNPKEGWDQFTEDDLAAMTYRIGNMTLLERALNKEIENFAYIAKRPILMGSQYGLTQKLAEDNSSWTSSTIVSRQRALAKLATSVWRIDQLS